MYGSRKFLGDPESTDVAVDIISAMNPVRCFYNVGRIRKSKLWVEYAQHAVLDGESIEDMSFWLQDIRQVQSALKELEPESGPLHRPFLIWEVCWKASCILN